MPTTTYTGFVAVKVRNLISSSDCGPMLSWAGAKDEESLGIHAVPFPDPNPCSRQTRRSCWYCGCLRKGVHL